MSNFEYIISSLPYLTMDFKYAGQAGFNSVISDIKRDLDEKDQGLVEFLLKGFSDKELNADFYAAALRPSRTPAPWPARKPSSCT